MEHDSTIDRPELSTRKRPAQLRLFSDPSILKQIGYERLFRFFRAFAADLQSAEIPWPDFHPGNDDFYVNLAHLLNRTSFSTATPQRPRPHRAPRRARESNFARPCFRPAAAQSHHPHHVARAPSPLGTLVPVTATGHRYH